MKSNLLTHSRMCCFKTCARKHQYQYELGVRRERESSPLRMGSAVHLGLELHGKGMSTDNASLEAIKGYEEVPAWANTDERLQEWLVEREKVWQLLQGYFWRWGNDHYELLATEQDFRIPLINPETGHPSTNWELAGKIDGIAKLPDGRLAVVEYKTTGDSIEPEGDYWKRLRIDQQISLYMVAARRLGFEVDTVLYDVIRKPTIKPRQVPEIDEQGYKIVIDQNGARIYNKNGKPRESADTKKGWILVSCVESANEYGTRLADDIMDRPDFYFARREIPRLDADLEDFEAELWQMQKTLTEARRNGRHFRNTSACLMYGACEYLDVCHNGQSIADEVPQGFTIVENVHPELELEPEE